MEAGSGGGGGVLVMVNVMEYKGQMKVKNELVLLLQASQTKMECQNKDSKLMCAGSSRMMDTEKVRTVSGVGRGGMPRCLQMASPITQFLGC